MTDDEIIEAWLEGRPKNTQIAYRRYANRLRSFIKKPLGRCTSADLKRYAAALAANRALSIPSRSFALSVASNLMRFTSEAGVSLPETSVPVRMCDPVEQEESLRGKTPDQGLSPSDIKSAVALEPNPRNAVIVWLLYKTGCLPCEIVRVRWGDLVPVGGQATIAFTGRSEKPRRILLDEPLWRALWALRKEETDDELVFQSRKSNLPGKALDTKSITRICLECGEYAGIEGFTPASIRTAHILAATDRGAPRDVIRRTLGLTSDPHQLKALRYHAVASSGSYLG